uniref:hypothetical protein n=1 Tax=Desulfovibrio cuneatus TaxID=159728 RepID=UPI0012EC4601
MQHGEVDHLREHPNFGLVNTKPDYGFDRNVGKDWWAGVRDLPSAERHPEAFAEAAKHPPVGAGRPPKVTSYAALGKELEARCGAFMAHGKPVRVTYDTEDYFMATHCDGRIMLSTHFHQTPKGGFNAAAELRNGWNALASGKQLTFKQEYAFESLWHEILHNRQVLGRNMKKFSVPHVVMETINQWTSRRTYHELLRSLGATPSHQADILKNGLAYGLWVRNFDSLLAHLGLHDANMLKAIRQMHETKPWHSYPEHLSAMLRK